MSMRPTILSNQSQKKNINKIQDEIERHQREIRLLKEKLEFKHKIDNLRMVRPPQKDLKWEKVDYQEIWKMGVQKVKKDSQDECIIF